MVVVPEDVGTGINAAPLLPVFCREVAEDSILEGNEGDSDSVAVLLAEG